MGKIASGCFGKILIAFLLLLALAFLIIRIGNFTYRNYMKQVNRCLSQLPADSTDLITEDDLAVLPGPVRKYLSYVGVVGTEKVSHYSITADGDFKLSKERDWTPVDVKQMSFSDDVTRLFYIKMKFMGVGIQGLHHYESAAATMIIKIMDLITVADVRGNEMNRSETVTVFNDMCLFAPSTLIDPRITWKEIDDKRVEGTFTNGEISISAILHFNEQGQLVDFVSYDRYHWNDDGTYDLFRWSTPVSEYREINGLNLPARAEAVWLYEEGPSAYARFNIQDITVNP